MSENLQFKDFHPLLNQEFQIEQEPGKLIPAELIEAIELKPYFADSDDETRTPFSIVFRAGRDIQLVQKTYLIKHDELGENQIFIVPLQPDGDGAYFEAVFT